MHIEFNTHKKYLVALTISIFLFATTKAQISIDGASCVKDSTSYFYMTTGTSSGWSYTWSISGGSINGVHNGNVSGTLGSGGNGLVVVWDASGSGTLSFYSSGGSASKSVTITTFLGGTITAGKNQTIAYNTVPASISCSAASGGVCTGGSLTYQWQQSADLANWSNISGATGLNYSPGALSASTYFRRMVTSSDLSNAVTYSDEASIFVNPTLSAGSISSPVSNTINYNTSPGTITGTAASGGSCSGSYSYQWEVSNDGLSFIDAFQGTDQNYTPNTLTSTIYFRRRVTCASQTMVSNSISIAVAPALVAGAIMPSSANIEYNTSPGTLSYSGTTGGNCGSSYTYQWQSSPDNSTWNNIGGAAGTSYSPGLLTSTIYYRVKVSCNGQDAYSAVMITTVQPPLGPGTIYGDNLPPLLTYNTSPGTLHGTSPSNGNCSGNYQYQWETSSDGSSWGPMFGANGTDYNPGNLLVTTYFRRKVTCSSATAYSNVLIIQVAAALGGGTISSSVSSIRFNSDPGTITGTSATGGNCSASYSYQWESSTDNLNYITLTGMTGLNCTPGNLATTKYFRRKVTCGSEIAYSNVVTISVYPPLTAGSITPASATINYNVALGNISYSGSLGGNCGGSYTITWQSSADNTTWADIPGSPNGPIYTGGVLSADTYFRVKASCGGEIAYSPVTKITLSGPVLAGTIGGPAAPITYYTAPSLTSVQDAQRGFCGGIYVYKWQYSTDGTTYETIYGSNSPTFSGRKITGTTWFRRIVYCNGVSATSNVVTVSVNPELRPGTVVPSLVSIATGANPGKITANAASGGNCNNNFTYQWQSSTDNISWTDIASTDPLSISPGNLSSTRYYRRKVTCGAEISYTNTSTVQVVSNTIVDMNYIKERNITKPGVLNETSAGQLTLLKEVKQTTQYFDGLSRLVQTVAKHGSLVTGETPGDLVAGVSYNGFGKQDVNFLPYVAAANDGDYRPYAVAEQNINNAQRFPDEKFYYGRVTLEPSSLHRVEETYAPGDNWVGNNRGIKGKAWFNTPTDDVKIWSVTDVANNWGTYAVTGIYPAGELYKTITVNEHGKQVIEFKDKEGQVILKKVQINGAGDDGSGISYPNWLCTYYVYDDLNRLRLVIQPMAVAHLFASGWHINTLTNVLPNLCFQYEYDARNRLIRKKVPDGGEVRMVYDARDRLVLTQDRNMRTGYKGWMYTQYDNLNRPVANGFIPDLTNYDNLAFHTNAAGSSTNYPDLNNYAEEEYTHTFYDNYNWLGVYTTTLDAIYDIAHNTWLLPASASFPYPQENVKSTALTGLVTGTRIRVVGNITPYLYSVNIYDDQGRIIQTKATNITGGQDLTTTQYAWNGQPLVIVQKQQKAGVNPQTHTTITKLTYDDLGRLLTTKKTVNSTINSQTISKPEQVIATHEYDALGQLKKKTLAPTGGAAGGPVETLTYDYNIRGWILGNNRDYAKDTNSTAHYFGFELAYDKNALNVNGISANYAANRLYNGNIAGMLWKSGGDNRVRRYDFSYDVASRLINADFKQFTGTTFNLNAGIDFSATGLSYDANGNIRTMNQRGWKPGGSVYIDSLFYNYYVYSNKLLNVIDSVNDPFTKLGDFRASGMYMQTLPGGKTNSTVDYTYEANGHLASDRNKDLESGIAYNQLQLVRYVQVKAPGGGIKGGITYTYDALGNKLKKEVWETGKPTKTTLYLGGAVYENDTLQFIGHEEGRLRYTKRRFVNGDSAYQFQYDYFLKDHLGNVRMVLTEQTDTAQYLASMETATRTKEDQLFYNIPLTAVTKTSVSGGYPTDPNPVTVPNDLVAKLNGSGNKVGPAIVLKIMSGDKVDIGVSHFYRSGGTANEGGNPLTDILTSLATGIIGVAGESKGTLTALSNSASSPLLGALGSFRTGNNPSQPTKPKAYLNWILLDEQLNYVAASSGAVPVSDADLVKPISYSAIPMTKNGFLYIYVSNETQNWDVFFDNLTIRHFTGPITEETHYYPFGLTMAGISSKALNPNYTENDKKYNGIELEGDLGLDIYDAQLRELDPQVGRWWQVDPKTENMEMWSPYASNYDNPIRYSDPLGDEGAECCGGWLQAAQDWIGARLDNAKENFRREAAWVRDGVERGLENAENNIKSGQSIPQRMWADFKENPLAYVSPAGPVGITKTSLQIAEIGAVEEITFLKVTTQAEAKATSKAVEKYEVGLYNDLKSRSLPGDDLALHHAPQTQPAKQTITDYERWTAPSIALPTAEHKAIPTLKGAATSTPRQQLAKDIRDLRKYTNAPNQSFFDLILLTKKQYPQSFIKK